MSMRDNEGLREGTSGGRFFFKVFIDRFLQIEVPVNTILTNEGGFWQNQTQDVNNQIIFFEVSTTDVGLKKIKALGITQISQNEFLTAEANDDAMKKRIHTSFEDIVEKANKLDKIQDNAQKERAKKLKDIADQKLGFAPRTRFDDFLDDFNEERGI